MFYFNIMFSVILMFLILSSFFLKNAIPILRPKQLKNHTRGCNTREITLNAVEESLVSI